ncbi:MAG: aminoglycoside phosphotransferase family protein [Armatimonadetes bacterium]|nr:aminoglycoside phosphotransferase family protein [Armatimonadota bacterium]
MSHKTAGGDRLAEAVARHWPGSVICRMWPLAGGISATTTALQVQLADGSEIGVVAREPGDWARKQHPEGVSGHEFRCQELLANLGLPVPEPYFVVPDGGEHGFFTVALVDGRPDFHPADLPDHLEQYAQFASRMHGYPVTGQEFSFLEEESWVLTMPTRELRHALREGEIREVMRAYGPPRRPNPRVLRHGDLWPGNMLWREGRLVSVIDWENLAVGDPLDEISVCRLDILWLFGKEAMDSFTSRYFELHPADMTDMAFWDLRASLRLINALEHIAPEYPKLGRADVTLEHLQSLHRWFVDQALAALPS